LLPPSNDMMLPEHLLIIWSDDDQFCEPLAYALRRLGFRCARTTSLEQVAEYAAEPPHVAFVLLIGPHPEMEAIETMIELIAPPRSLAGIFFTNRSVPVAPSAGSAVYGYQQLPFDLAELNDTLQRLIGTGS
jgi:DNA-binding NtrC family response regulator